MQGGTLLSDNNPTHVTAFVQISFPVIRHSFLVILFSCLLLLVPSARVGPSRERLFRVVVCFASKPQITEGKLLATGVKIVWSLTWITFLLWITALSGNHPAGPNIMINIPQGPSDWLRQERQLVAPILLPTTLIMWLTFYFCSPTSPSFLPPEQLFWTLHGTCCEPNCYPTPYLKAPLPHHHHHHSVNHVWYWNNKKLNTTLLLRSIFLSHNDQSS